MLQRLKLFTRLLGVYLNPHQGMALLERVKASNLRDADRDRITRIIRATLQLPDARGHEPSVPNALLPPRPTPQREATGQRQSANARPVF